jgi:hypothetical protein
MLLQYQPNTCHLSIRPLGKTIQRWQENAFLRQWRVFGWPPNLRWSGGKLVFPPSTGRSAPVSLMGIVIVNFTHAIAGFWKNRSLGGKGAAFGAGVAAPFVASLSAARSRTPYCAVLRRL